VNELLALLGRFWGRKRAPGGGSTRTPQSLANGPPRRALADASLVHHAESLLAGAIGRILARVMVASVVEEEASVSTRYEYHRRGFAGSRLQPALEQSRANWRRRTKELRGANQRLQEIDRLKTISSRRCPLNCARAHFDPRVLGNPERQTLVSTRRSAPNSSASSSRNPNA